MITVRKLELNSMARFAVDGLSAPEYVALGFMHPDGVSDSVMWFPLPNIAPTGEFYVEAEEVAKVLSAAAEQGLDASRCGVVLWHSHYIAVEPSEADLSNLPEWVDVGIVFHAPTETSTLYNKGGVINSNEAILDAPRDTLVG